MKRLTVFVMFVGILLLMVLGCQAGNEGGNKKVTLDTEKAKVSYGIGFSMGESLKPIKDEVELETVLQGLRDGLQGGDKAQMNPEDIKKTLIEFQQKQSEIMVKKRQESAGKNKAEGEAFLKENAKKEGVVTTGSGLQYKALIQGTGPTPKATDMVKVHYRGTLLDGTEFDSSYKRGQPATFALNRVIPAWTEGVQLMKVGAKYMFFAPANLAYGERGAGQNIGPNSTLIFEVELLGIEPPAQDPAAQPKTQESKK
ncbi:MAG: FKBP-type peptidyl-prolyl cis-trans isomerase [Acidobacteria bacterium]|nr:FKBP-type peptidyl-prolyl cis-trans isomerase [Acidobacteriota bacterium]